jgi:iron complex outermembrane receptor protein
LNTLVLIDGRRINQVDLSGVDWTLIPKDRVERIEIVRGGRGSVLYGDNATAGVINIITRKGSGETEARGKMLLGSYETYQLDGSASDSSGGLALAVTGNYRSSDGYRDNSDTRAKDVGVNLTYEATERLSIDASGGYHQDDTGLPGALTRGELDSGASRRDSLHPDDYADTEDWYLLGGAKLFITDNNYLSVNASKRRRSSDFFSFFDAGEYTGKTEIDTRGWSPQLSINERLFGLDANILLGFDYEKSDEDIRNESVFFGFPSTASYELSRRTLGAYGHTDLALTDRLSVSGGLRWDQATFRFKAVEAGASESNRLDQTLYTTGLTWRVTDQSTVYASYARSFRYPALDEMYNFFDNTVNSDLDLQTSDDLEVGLRHRFAWGLAVDLNVFRVVTRDEIFFNPATFANENLDGDSIRRGFEMAFEQALWDIRFKGSYTFRDTEVDGGQYDGSELPNVPKHQWTLGASRTFGSHVELALDGTYIGKRRFISDFANSHGDQDDYFLLNGKLSYLWDKGSAYLAVYNLFNKEYSEYGALNYLGEEGFYPSPRINLLAGVSFSY